MRASHLAVGVVVVSLLVVAVAAGPAAAQVDNSDETEEAICGDAPSGNSLVLVLPDDTYIYADDGARRLLPGTTAELVLCSDEDLQPIDSAWVLDEESVTGASVTETHDRNYDITVEEVERPTEIVFELSTSPTGSVDQPTVNATPGAVTTARLGGNTYQIALNDSDETKFERAHDSYVETLDEMHSSAEGLNESAGGTQFNATSNDTTGLIADINQTQAVRDNYTAIQETLFSSARSGNANAVGALNGYEAYHDRTLTQTRNELVRANQNIAQKARSTALGVFANFVGVLLVGAILGGIGGRVATNRILVKVEDKRRRTSAVDFHPKHLAGQLLLAVVLLGMAIAVVVTQELLEPLLAVFAAVIGL